MSEYLTDLEVSSKFSISRQSLWRWLKTIPDFPKPVKLSSGTTRWRALDIENYMNKLESQEYLPETNIRYPNPKPKSEKFNYETRDDFAKLALNCVPEYMLQLEFAPDNLTQHSKIAKWCYGLADAMLNERQTINNNGVAK